jgi:hypothetical protein
MADLNALAPNYRRARERWPDAPTLSRCHESLVACFAGNAHGQVEQVKAFIESVCLTILGEFHEPMPSATPSTTDLLVAALKPLGLQNTKGASKLDKVLSGFNRLADALTDMRNDHGPVAHGKDGFLDALATDHARTFVHTGDMILSVLLNALEGKEPDLTFTREPYERFTHLNERIDQAVSVDAYVDADMVVIAVGTGPREEAIEIRVEPSRLLYSIDRAAYIEVLKTADGVVEEEEEDEEEEEEEDDETVAGSEEIGDSRFAKTTESAPSVVVRDYVGRLAVLRPALRAFLTAESWKNPQDAAEFSDLTESILATMDQNMGLDWKQREVLQARLRVACRRVLMRFGSEIKKAEEVAEKLVTWARIQVPDDLGASQKQEMA